jgi:hypothetical protein
MQGPLTGPQLRLLIAVDGLREPCDTHALANGMGIATGRIDELIKSLEVRGLTSFDHAGGWRITPAGMRTLATVDTQLPELRAWRLRQGETPTRSVEI